MTPLQSRSLPSTSPRTHTSFSAISTYQACPLKYAFKYIQSLPEDTVSASLVLGGAIHRALQMHYEDLLEGREPPTLDQLLDVFWDEWHQHDHQRIQFGKGEGLVDIAELAERMLKAFQRSDIAQPKGNIIAVEEQMRGELVAGVPELLARLDLIVETETELTVLDFKTARSQWSRETAADASSQLMLYGELVRDLVPDKPLRLQFAVLTKTKVPDVAVLDVPFNRRHVDRTKRVVERVWQAIRGEHIYPAPSPIHCPSCPYRQPCQEWRG